MKGVPMRKAIEPRVDELDIVDCGVWGPGKGPKGTLEEEELAAVSPRIHDLRKAQCPKGGIWQEYNASGESSSQLVLMKTRKPQWSDSAQAWTLNFKGRVKLASKKNFMLVDKSDETEAVLMLFGRVGRNRFSLDYREPLSVLQVTAVALSSFASKMLVT